jgi:hypothetical protein
MMAHQSVDIRPETGRRRLSIWQRIKIAGRLILPVLGLFGAFAVAFLTKDIPVTELDPFLPGDWYLTPSYWLTWGHLALPLVFLVVNLTNRAYGADYALAQVLVCWALLAGQVYWVYASLGGALTADPLPPLQNSIAFVVAMVVGQLVCIGTFDLTRGRIWWTAPFWGTLLGAAFFVVLYHTIAHWGYDEPWGSRLLIDLGIKVASAFVLLIPYFLLRGAIRPAPGFGGA